MWIREKGRNGFGENSICNEFLIVNLQEKDDMRFDLFDREKKTKEKKMWEFQKHIRQRESREIDRVKEKEEREIVELTPKKWRL